MNVLSNLEKVVHKSKKRLGRGAGSAKGAKSGRGTTRHQAARGKIPLAFEGGQNRMVKRFPLLRGKGRNKSVQEKPIVVSLSMLERLDGKEVVNTKVLAKFKIIKEKQQESKIKIVANGKITKPLTIALPVSKSARSIIEKAGGKVQ